jgi:hypothetical protein
MSELNNSAEGAHVYVSMVTINGYIVDSYVWVHNNVKGKYSYVYRVTMFRPKGHNFRLH